MTEVYGYIEKWWASELPSKKETDVKLAPTGIQSSVTLRNLGGLTFVLVQMEPHIVMEDIPDLVRHGQAIDLTGGRPKAVMTRTSLLVEASTKANGANAALTRQLLLRMHSNGSPNRIVDEYWFLPRSGVVIPGASSSN